MEKYNGKLAFALTSALSNHLHFSIYQRDVSENVPLTQQLQCCVHTFSVRISYYYFCAFFFSFFLFSYCFCVSAHHYMYGGLASMLAATSITIHINCYYRMFRCSTKRWERIRTILFFQWSDATSLFTTIAVAASTCAYRKKKQRPPNQRTRPVGMVHAIQIVQAS